MPRRLARSSWLGRLELVRNPEAQGCLTVGGRRCQLADRCHRCFARRISATRRLLSLRSSSRDCSFAGAVVSALSTRFRASGGATHSRRRRSMSLHHLALERLLTLRQEPHQGLDWCQLLGGASLEGQAVFLGRLPSAAADAARQRKKAPGGAFEITATILIRTCDGYRCEP